jgi:hypothetical protein
MSTTWKKLDSTSTADMLQELRCTEPLLQNNHNTHLYHSPAWQLEAEERDHNDVNIYLITNEDQCIGYAPFIMQPWTWRLRLGEVTLSKFPMKRFYIHGGPLFAGDLQNPEKQFADLLAYLRPGLGKQDILYFEGVRTNGKLYEELAQNPSLKKMYISLRYGNPYDRQFIRFPNNFDEYMLSLSRRTREGLRRNLRKLTKFVDGDIELKRVTTPDDVEEFVPKAVSISKKTYQWNLLGLGLREPEKLKQTLSILALKNWTCCYLLECKKQPVAFMIGYRYAGTYYYIDVGFDPDWSKWSVGSLLHLEVIRDLYDHGDDISLFDFSPGTGEHKERFSNEQEEEVNLILLPANLTNRFRVFLYRITELASHSANRLLEKLGIKTKLKKFIRSLSTSKK